MNDLHVFFGKHILNFFHNDRDASFQTRSPTGNAHSIRLAIFV